MDWQKRTNERGETTSETLKDIFISLCENVSTTFTDGRLSQKLSCFWNINWLAGQVRRSLCLSSRNPKRKILNFLYVSLSLVYSILDTLWTDRRNFIEVFHEKIDKGDREKHTAWSHKVSVTLNGVILNEYSYLTIWTLNDFKQVISNTNWFISTNQKLSMHDGVNKLKLAKSRFDTQWTGKKFSVFFPLILLVCCCSYSICVKDLEKFNLIWWFDFRIEPIFPTAQAALKILFASKVVRKDQKIITLLYCRSNITLMSWLFILLHLQLLSFLGCVDSWCSFTERWCWFWGCLLLLLLSCYHGCCCWCCWCCLVVNYCCCWF